MRVLFCTSDLIGARLIRAVTWSQWSHVAIIDGDDVIEAVWPKVRVAPLAEVLDKHPIHTVVDFPCLRDDLAIAWARSQVGKPYDLKGMLGLGLHRDWQDDEQWWCSEMTLEAANHGGYMPFRASELHRVTPQHLWMVAPEPSPPDLVFLSPLQGRPERPFSCQQPIHPEGR